MTSLKRTHMKQCRPWGFLTSVMGITLVLGCGKGVTPPKLPPTVVFKGNVTMDGKPLPKALVTFTTTAAQNGFNATGITNDAGEYVLKTSSGSISQDGAAPGKYKVHISRFVDPKGEPQDPAVPVAVPGKQSIPDRFSNPATTKLEATVDAKGGTQNFDLKSK